MIRRTVSCSWCHHLNGLDDPAVLHCAACGHRVDLPRSECDCSLCRPTPYARAEQKRLDRLAMEYLTAVVTGDLDDAGRLWGMAETDQALGVMLHGLDAELAR
jgi:hypothetical protein